MSSLINSFNIFRDFPPNFKQNIKSFFVSSSEISDNDFGYCILNDNTVYGLGKYIHKTLGYNECTEKYVLINELFETNIEEFYIIPYVEMSDKMIVFARNNKNEIFSWGCNTFGLLARGYYSNKYLKPEKIKFFDHKEIIKISCGASHQFALSSNGEIYGWGINCDEEDFKKWEIFPSPLKIELNEKIRYIHCTMKKSLAVSFDGNLLLFNSIKNPPLKINEGIKVSSILYSVIYEFYIQSDEGKIYEFCEDDKISPLKEVCNYNQLVQNTTTSYNKVIDIYRDGNTVVVETEEGVSIFNNSKLEKTSHKSLVEYFLFEKQVTYKTIHIRDKKLFINSIEINEKNSLTITNKLEEIYSINNFTSSKYRNLYDLPQIMNTNVKFYYQSGGSGDYFGFIVTGDNRVYCIGNNEEGKLGLGHNNKIFNYTEITELINQNIQEFYEGFNSMYAQNDKNHIFSWGQNQCGQLGRSCISEKEDYLKPKKIDYFDDKKIIQISCDIYNCLALSSDGRVYEFGNNLRQMIERPDEIVLLSTPTEVDIKSQIKFIRCSGPISFMIGFDEKIYFKREDRISIDFGGDTDTIKYPLNIYFHFLDESFIILLKDGSVLKVDKLKDKIENILFEDKIIDLYYDLYNDYCLFQSKDNVYQLIDNSIIKTNYLNFFDFYLQNSKCFPKTIEITEEGDLKLKRIYIDEKNIQLILKEEYIFNSKYENIFKEVMIIGRGRYTYVFKVIKNSNKINYAVKRLEMKDKLNLDEIKMMSKLDNNYIVQYIDSWIEVKSFFNQINRYIFIQMEFCEQNLRQFIECKNEISEGKFETFCYFISCELFKELIECVNYLHSLKPQIIHRDLKPENILISDGINGRFLKLCDFGISKIHEESNHSRMVGTINYMAPEVLYSRKYNTKSDIYSLSLIGTEIFGFEDKVLDIKKHKTREDFDKYLSKYLNTNLNTKFRKLLDLISNCLLPEDYDARPDCNGLLNNIDDISIFDIVFNEENIEYQSYSQILEKYSLLTRFFENKIYLRFEMDIDNISSPTELVNKTLIFINKSFKSSILCEKASSFLFKVFKNKDLSSQLIEKLGDTTLLVMSTHPKNKIIQRFSLSIFIQEDIFRKLSLNWTLCSKLILETLILFEETEMNLMAMKIFQKLIPKLSENELNHIRSNVVYIKAIIETIKRTNDLPVLIYNTEYKLIEFSLKTLFIFTVESHVSSQLVYLNSGMEFWIKILKRFKVPVKISVILAILSHIAEVPNLRINLINEELLCNLRELLFANQIFVRHHAIRIFANLICGNIICNNSSPELSDILSALEPVVMNLEPHLTQFFYQTSFKSYLPMLYFNSPVIQLWAVWTLHHLCSINVDRYYEMFINIDGLRIIDSILEKTNEETDIEKKLKEYCKLTLDVIRNYEKTIFENKT